MKKSIKVKTLIYVFFLTAYLLTVNGHYGSDGFYSYLTAESLVLDHDFAINDRPFNLPEMSRGIGGDQQKGIDGKHYSRYGIGLALVEVPFYAVGHLISKHLPSKIHDYITMFSVSLTNAFIAALLCLMFYIIALEFGYSEKTSFSLTVILGFGTYLWPYSRYGFSEPLLILFLLASFYATLIYKKTGAVSSLIWAGFFLAATVAAKYNAIYMVPSIIIYFYSLIYRLPIKDQINRSAWFLTPFCLIMMLLSYYNYFRFGSPYFTGYQGPQEYFNLLYLRYSIPELLLSFGKGIIVFSPIVLLSPLSFPFFIKKHDKEAYLFLLIIILNFLFIGSFKYWGGDLSWGPRLIMPILPFAILPLGGIIKKYLGATILLVLIGFLVNLPATIINTADWAFAVGCHYFNFMLSPPVGGWVQLIFAFFSIIKPSFQTIVFGGIPISLKLIARFDLWFTNIGSLDLKILNYASLAVIIFLFVVLIYSLIRINKLLRA
jgi:hypothetical protein